MKLRILIPALLALLLLCGCSGRDGGNNTNTAAPANAAGTVNAADPQNTENTAKGSEMNNTNAAQPRAVLVIKAGGKTFYANLEDNPSARAFIEKLSPSPITVDMHDYGSFEKVGDLPWELPRSDEQITTQPGDVILYLGKSITIYYDRNSWSFTRLAKIGGATKEALLEALGSGNVSVTFSLEWSE